MSLEENDNFEIPNLSATKHQTGAFDASDFEEFGKMFKTETSNKDSKSIAAKIRSLPPEIKALLIDNLLKKRDDI